MGASATQHDGVLRKKVSDGRDTARTARSNRNEPNDNNSPAELSAAMGEVGGDNLQMYGCMSSLGRQALSTPIRLTLEVPVGSSSDCCSGRHSRALSATRSTRTTRNTRTETGTTTTTTTTATPLPPLRPPQPFDAELKDLAIVIATIVAVVSTLLVLSLR